MPWLRCSHLDSSPLSTSQKILIGSCALLSDVMTWRDFCAADSDPGSHVHTVIDQSSTSTPVHNCTQFCFYEHKQVCTMHILSSAGKKKKFVLRVSHSTTSTGTVLVSGQYLRERTCSWGLFFTQSDSCFTCLLTAGTNTRQLSVLSVRVLVLRHQQLIRGWVWRVANRMQDKCCVSTWRVCMYY